MDWNYVWCFVAGIIWYAAFFHMVMNKKKKESQDVSKQNVWCSSCGNDKVIHCTCGKCMNMFTLVK